MSGLAKQLDDARAEVARLERMSLAATCLQLGRHDWESTGGCNAGCDLYCSCSVPVNHCVRCGECDYGENSDAIEVRSVCAERRKFL